MISTIEKTENYRIEFNTSNEEFYLYVNMEDTFERHGSYPTYNSANKAYKRYVKKLNTMKKKKIKPLIVLDDDYDEIIQYKLTSIANGSRWNDYGQIVWATELDTKNRRQRNISSFVKDTPENRELFNKIKTLYNEAERLEKKLERLKIDEIIKHFGSEE